MTKFSNNIVFNARYIAYYAHIDQVDKGGNPYIFHLVNVANGCDSPDAQAAGYLHDILEDTDTTVQDLRNDGVSENVIEAVTLLTRTDDETYRQYLEKLKPNKIARQVKLADLRDNLDPTRLNDPEKDRNSSLMKRYQKAVEFLNS